MSAGPCYSKTSLKGPYSPEEIVALLNFADSHSSNHRSVSLKALITLGAGCGLSRADLRPIAAANFHLHDDRLFVVAKRRCALVLPDYVELANTQYYGWALQNRAALLPTRVQLERAVEIVAAAESGI